MFLNDIEMIRDILKNERTSKIKTFHKFLFNNDGDRSNRKRIREFSGFKFEINSTEFNDKLTEIQTNYSLCDLVTIANILCVNNEGSLTELSNRLLTYLCNLKSLQENLIDNESDSESETQYESNEVNISKSNVVLTDKNSSFEQISSQNSTNINTKAISNTALNSNFGVNQLPAQNIFNSNVSFHDIESIIGTFDGSASQNIEKWFLGFEDVVNVFNLNDIQKFIFVKRSMRGRAQLLVQSEPQINSFGKLKELLVSEFASQFNSAELHNILSKRKLKENETLDEYFFTMKQLCSRGGVEDAALIDYIVKGIPDSTFKKSFLYGCGNLSEFRQKLKVYAKIRSDSENNVFDKPKTGVSSKDKFFQTKTDRCYNCGLNGHKSSTCRNKDNGPRCFNCFKYGHKSFTCDQPKRLKSKPSHINTVNAKSLMTKQVKISSLDFMSLIDTGSEKTLMKEGIYHLFPKIPNLEYTNITLTGLGNSKIKPLGFFTTDIVIDNSNFNATVYVVPDFCLTFDIIVGTDVIQQGILTINRNEINLSKISEDNSDKFLVNVSNVLEEPNVDLTHITNEKIRSQILTCIQNYSPNKTKSIDVKMNITLTDEIPINSPPRRLALTEKKFVEKQISEWLDQGVIRKSTSDFSSPIVLAKKKDSSFRLCIDYRRLNSKTYRQRFPLPVIDDVIDQLHSAKVFSTLDLKNAFLHVDVEESSRKYTSFVTHSGQFEFLKMPYGLSNSPLVFQRYVYNIFRDLINDNVLIIYLDDIIIPAVNEKEGLEKLQRVLHTASEYGLELNMKKCQFLKRDIEFLGYRIENGQLHPSPLKIKAVLNFPEPKSVKDLQSYLGLTSYFRKFIENYSSIAKPLSDLLRKDTKFHFDSEQKAAFNKLKHILASEPVLHIYNPHSETEIHCDASIDGYGAILFQKSRNDNMFHPVYFMSRKTTDTERKYSSYELEVMAVIEALKKFRIYVLGIPFKIVTDCNAFKLTMNKKDLCTKIARWALMLSDFNYTIEHRQGSRMRHVDALSRNPICMLVQDSLTLKVIESQNTDEHIKAVKEILKTNSYEDYFIKNNVLYKHKNGIDLLVVPEDVQLDVIRKTHEKGHFGRKRCEELMKEEIFIPNLSGKIDKVIANCITCILHNRKYGKQEGELHPLPKENIPLQTYHIDHLGPLETTHKNYKYIFCIIDSFSKFVWLYPCKTTASNEVIEKLRLQSHTFGNPVNIVSDRGSAFTSKEFKDYCDEENIKHILITTGLPRANGQVERLNSIVISVISKMSTDEPKHWFKHVLKVQQVINSTYQRSVGKTPFELLIGIKMHQKNDLNIIELLNSANEEQFCKERNELREEAKKNILKVQQENRKQYNLRRRPPRKYQPGELVAIKRTHHGPGLKLKTKFLGPYKIIRAKSNDTYDVQKAADVEGPQNTSTCIEYMKPWIDK